LRDDSLLVVNFVRNEIILPPFDLARAGGSGEGRIMDDPPVDLLIEDDRWTALDLALLAERSATAALGWAGLDPAAGWEVAVLACDDARIATLNAEFRGKARPTNVLSWPSEERGSLHPGEVPAPPDLTRPELGDVAIAFETCAREAEAQGKPLEAHVTHLLVHATLHLLGYDHAREEDAALMEEAETCILGQLGLPDPYAAS
jgi:probable rRNA maturation factor